MAQKLTTKDWTQITGLASSKNYLFQAQYTLGSTNPIPVEWLQSSSEPASTDDGILAADIQLSGNEDIYVRTSSVPTNIVFFELA